jgi:hypothetical protein
VPEYGSNIPILIGAVAPMAKRLGLKLLAATRPAVAAAPAIKLRLDFLLLLIVYVSLFILPVNLY